MQEITQGCDRSFDYYLHYIRKISKKSRKSIDICCEVLSTFQFFSFKSRLSQVISSRAFSSEDCYLFICLENSVLNKFFSSASNLHEGCFSTAII
jgi:hypothetical protein